MIKVSSGRISRQSIECLSNDLIRISNIIAFPKMPNKSLFRATNKFFETMITLGLWVV